MSAYQPVDRLMPDRPIEEEIRFIQKLLFLASRDHLYIDLGEDGDFDKNGAKAAELGPYRYSTVEKYDLTEEDIDFHIKMYSVFGSSGLEAWGHFTDAWLPNRDGSQAYKDAFAYLQDRSLPMATAKVHEYNVSTGPTTSQFVVTNYPSFDRLWPDVPPEKELEQLHKVIFLAAVGAAFFGTYDEDETTRQGKGTWTVNARGALLMNDTFYYASADAERFGADDVDLLVDLQGRFSYHGLIAWASLKRSQDPIKPHMKPEFYEALKYIQSLEG